MNVRENVDGEDLDDDAFRRGVARHFRELTHDVPPPPDGPPCRIVTEGAQPRRVEFYPPLPQPPPIRRLKESDNPDGPRLPWRVRPGLAWGFLLDGFIAALGTLLGDPRHLNDLDLLVKTKLRKELDERRARAWTDEFAPPLTERHRDVARILQEEIVLRSPGKLPPLKSLEEWIAARGVDPKEIDEFFRRQR